MEDERQTETETADLDAQEHEETVSQVFFKHKFHFKVYTLKSIILK